LPSTLVTAFRRACGSSRDEPASAGAGPWYAIAERALTTVMTEREEVRDDDRAESSALEELRKLRELFMQSPALIVLMRGKDHVYDFVNTAAAKLIRRTDAVGKPVREVLLGAPPHRLAALDRVLRTGERHVGTNVPSFRDWNGNGKPYERFFNVIYEPYRGPTGEVEGVMSFGFEVTDQVHAKSKLEAAVRELENANRAKDEFLATVSHELRTPLTAILGWVRMLRAGGLTEEKRTRALETIERNANAQAQLIEDLLDVSRIGSGRLRLEIDTVDLAAVVEDAIDAIRPAAQSKKVDVREMLDPSLGHILGDAARLRQVVWNLLTNAVKFTPSGGTVTVAVQKRDSAVEISVVDDGQGIAPEFLPNVFERFRQADATTTRTQGGLGLGLAIVRHIVELHGGTVVVESDGPGKGARFTVCLPLSPPESTALAPAALRVGLAREFERSRQLDGLHVLIVDDEPDARELLAEMLLACMARVTTASSAADALRVVTKLRPDVVVSDIAMPGEDGHVFVRKLRALSEEGGGRTPAVALSAYSRVEDRTKALLSGFNMHVAKPVEPAELIAVLSNLTSMNAARRP
jgi:signal transduction histidine kinase/ActR/RegA family two-component response regulator